MKKLPILFLLLMIPLLLFGVSVEENPVFDIPDDQAVIINVPATPMVNQAERSNTFVASYCIDDETRTMELTSDDLADIAYAGYAIEARRDVIVVLKEPILSEDNNIATNKMIIGEDKINQSVWHPIPEYVMLN